MTTGLSHQNGEANRRYEIGELESPCMEDAVAIYDASGPVPVFDHWLAVLMNLGVRTSAKAGSTLAQIRDVLQIGLPRVSFDNLRTDLGVSTEEFADVLGIPARTLARRTERFKPDESEKLLRVGSVVQKAFDVLEDMTAVRRWLNQPKRALGGLTPLRCCDTEIGAREVEALLIRIEHGVFS
jgi:putative toxin-antitoxin system antitoxin component (TIGR02293 family)